MLRREWCFLDVFAMAKRHEDDVDDANDEVLSREMDEVEEREAVRWPGRRIARRPGTESMMGRPTGSERGKRWLLCCGSEQTRSQVRDLVVSG